MKDQSRGRLTPGSEHLLSEVAIVCRLARRTLRETPAIPWENFESDYDVIRDAISRVVPDFEDFNDRVRKPGGFGLANPVNGYQFNTTSGKAQFTCNTFDRILVPPGHLVLQTMRSHDQWNTVPYAPNDRYRGIRNGRRIVLINPADIEELALTDRQLVDLVRPGRTVSRGARRIFASSHIPPRGVQQPRITRRPTCSFRWTASPTSATHPHPRASSCGSNRRNQRAHRSYGGESVCN
jgi:anaerobic selenocysteine-containing dehydrogenase